ncbi:MAG: hypothetical protein J7K53_12240, partial [Bacteroidales bacterium]|nr:hypothetical protein [Bacteroidales bacterium]
IKKEINGLTHEVISDCFLYLYMNKDKNKKEVTGIMKDTIKTRNNLIHKVNHPDSGDRKKIKKHFSKLKSELVNKMDSYFTKLSKISKGTEESVKK